MMISKIDAPRIRLESPRAPREARASFPQNTAVHIAIYTLYTHYAHTSRARGGMDSLGKALPNQDETQAAKRTHCPDAPLKEDAHKNVENYPRPTGPAPKEKPNSKTTTRDKRANTEANERNDHTRNEHTQVRRV